jgi:hypothetical protein
MIIYILIFILIGIVVALGGSIRLKFHLNRQEQVLSASYLFILFAVDIKSKTGILRLAMIPIKKISFQKIGSPLKKKASIAAKPKETKKSRFQFKFDYLHKFYSLLKRIRIKQLMLAISGGFSDSYETGVNYGYYWALKGIFPKIMSHIDYKPDFSSSELQFDGSGDIRIRMIHLIIFGLRMFIEIFKGGFGHKPVPQKKGLIYA